MICLFAFKSFKFHDCGEKSRGNKVRFFGLLNNMGPRSVFSKGHMKKVLIKKLALM